ncbi:MAG: alpha-amylase family glycosyl hydrolase [Candidatus Promineifilaceae bacterium]
MFRFLIFVVMLCLVACAEPVPTPTPVPTATAVPPTLTPMPTPLPTATPDPFVTGTNGLPWWNDAVFYEVFVRSFYDSDGDGIGDINGLIEKLDYINDGDPTTNDDLGATGIWLMPIAVSPSYHGYDVVDYFEVDPDYGTNEDFERLMEEAHARGIHVIVDLVMNHTSAQHPWFIDSKDRTSDKRDWYVWEDESPGFRGPWGQGVWHKSGDAYYYGVFWGGMPDLNFRNPDVTQAIYEAAEYWLDEMGVDGFRLDAIKHMIEDDRIQENSNSTHAWMADFYTFYKGVNPNALTVGEAWTGTRQVVDYTGDEVDIAFQFDLALDILNSADSGLSPQIIRAQTEIYDSFPPSQYATFITNHDQNRVMSRLDGEVDKAKLAASLLLTAPGVPFVYYGEEIGMTGKKPDEDIRLPMQWQSNGPKVGFTTGTPWRPAAGNFPVVSVARQTDDADSLLTHYRTLIGLRAEHEALRVGDWTLIETNSPRIYSFLRHTENEMILVVINTHRNDVSAEKYSLELPTSPLTDGMHPTALFGMGDPVAPTVNSSGGFAAYHPFDEIPARSAHIVKLTQP